MKILRPAAAAVLALAVMTGCSSGASSTDPKPSASSTTPAVEQVLTKPNPSEKLLFVARSPEASFDLDEDGEGTLTLSSTATMTWFADRPDHDAGTTTTVDALAAFGWKRNGDDLGDEPPNGVLTGDELSEAVVVELLTADRDGDALTFTVKAVNDVPAAEHNADVTHADLFIDDVGPTIIGSSGATPVGLCPWKPEGVTQVKWDYLLMPDGTRGANVYAKKIFKDNTNGWYASGWWSATVTAAAPEVKLPGNYFGKWNGIDNVTFDLDPENGNMTAGANCNGTNWGLAVVRATAPVLTQP
jgi:hypothetical protein